MATEFCVQRLPALEPRLLRSLRLLEPEGLFPVEHLDHQESDIIRISEELAGVSLHAFFTELVYGTNSYEPMLTACFDFVGLDMVKVPSSHPAEREFGFKTIEHGAMRKVSIVAPDSPAWCAGISIGDDVIAVNGYALKNDLDDWLNYFVNETVVLSIQSGGKLKQFELKKQSGITYFDAIRLRVKSDRTASASENAKNWQLGMCR